MKETNPYRNAEYGEKLIKAIKETITKPWKIMDVCGGQAHAIAKYNLEELLPQEIQIIHGPGCPVCVTPQSTIDTAINLVLHHQAIVLSFGDMLRVPGSEYDLLTAKSMGGDIRIIYSPLDAITIAQQNPNKEVVLFAIGFETTAPIHAQVVLEAERLKISNLSLLTALFAVPPIIEHMCSLPDFEVDGILAAGHVCAITGLNDYDRLAKKYNIPFAVTGFEPVDILLGIYTNIKQLEQGECTVENPYSRIVVQQGNQKAKEVLNSVFKQSEQEWRGLGSIPSTGFSLRKEYAHFDAYTRFRQIKPIVSKKEPCIAGEIMKGLATPKSCPYFGIKCKPELPLGAPMVSSEGVCAAYYRYRKHA